MIEIEKYARAAASTARTPPNSPARQAAIEAENTARVAAEQFVKGLEAERDELRARLAEIEAQEPVLWAPSCASHEFASEVRGYGQQLTVWFDRPAAEHPGRGHCQTPLFTKPSPAQAVPDADGARFRWLCEDHGDRETREQCRRLIDRLTVMSYSDAVMSIDAAMAAAPEHKA